MIIQCKSCNKSFNVPDDAIGNNGRLVQCSSCGNKWTQYPEKKRIEVTKKTSEIKKKSKKQTKKNKFDSYSEEYLKKKHGIKIIDPSSLKTNKIQKNTRKQININFGFYNYIILMVVFILTLFGVLNLTKEIIIFNYPFLEVYINYAFETIDNIKLIIFDIISE